MGVFQDVYMQYGIKMDIQLLEKLIDDAKDSDQNGEYIRGLEDALGAIESQLDTFPWE